MHYSSFGTLYVTFVTAAGVQLFWFDGMQFVKQQTLPSTQSADYVQWMRLPNQEIALAVASKGRLNFYSQDIDVSTFGANLQLTHSLITYSVMTRLFIHNIIHAFVQNSYESNEGQVCPP